MRGYGLVWSSLLFVMAGASLSAQAGSATLNGSVFDPMSAPVPDALVAVIELESHALRSTMTSDAGTFTITGLGPGSYRVTVERRGFSPLVRDRIELRTGETVRLDMALSVGGVVETVTVAGETPVLRESSASLGQVIDHERVLRLPLVGRSFVTLASLAPGVALPPGSQFPRINGGRPRTNEYLFDGISVLQPEPGQVAIFPVIDAIQEFKIESNSPPAEFGRFNGGVINLTTKSGTNTLHGSGFEFLRHEALNARNFFAPGGAAKPEFRRQQFGGTAGGPVARDRTFFFVDYQRQRQHIGRTVISTVPTLLQRQGIFTEPIAGRTPVVYDPATTVSNGAGGFMRSPFPGNAIPTNRIDPVSLRLLQRYPLPREPGTANNYRRTATESDDQDQVYLRIDHNFASNRDQAFGRLSYFNGSFVPVAPLPDGSGTITSGTLGPQDTRAWAFASNYQYAFSDRWFNELRFGDTRRAVKRSAAQLPGTASSALGLTGLPSSAQFPNTLPTFQISGYQQLGSPANTASDFSTGVRELADSLTWLAGKHTVKLGFDARWQRLNVIQPPSPTGLFQFSALFTDLPGVPDTGSPLASFLLGEVQMFSIDLQRQQIRNRARFQEYFVQDDWRLSDRWTISPGLRYTLNFPSTEESNQAAVFNLETRQLEYLGRDGRPRSARELHNLNFAPRLGIVGRMTDRDIVSTGYALVWIEQAGITTPFTTPVFPFLQTVSQRTLDSITPALVLSDGASVAPIPLVPAAGLGQGVFAVDRDLGSGYVQQWNLSYQRQLARRVSAEIAYVGSKITHVGIPDSNLNQLTAQQLAEGPALLQRVPNPFFGQIPRSSSLGDPTIPRAQLLKPFPEYTTVSLYRNNVGTTFYQGLTAKIEQRFSDGLSYLVSYTRSKLMDDASAVFDASILTGPIANYPVADSFNRRLERDYSTGDIPHVLVSSLVWELPTGEGRKYHARGLAGVIANDWTLTGIVTLQSGVPLAVTQATNFNAFAGFGTQRPNLVGDPQLPRGERSVRRWFNTDAFAVAPQFTLGSASRNPVRGPSFCNVDMALIRRMALPGRAALDLRAEVFNLFNTPAFGNPNAVFGAANFGTITTAGDPRVVQLALKLTF